MTAEIAVMNREAVALAADSAVALATERGPKVYQSATKIFALSRSAPLGLMIYGNAQFLEVPWDTIAKVYREELGPQRFPTLAEHAEHFIQFVEGSKLLFPADAQRRCAEHTVLAFFLYLRKRIEDRIEERLVEQGAVTDSEIHQEASAEIETLADLFRRATQVPYAPKGIARKIAAALRSVIPEIRDSVLERLPLTPRDKQRVGGAARALFTKNLANPTSPNRSGIVLAGFGSEEIYPSLVEYVFEALVADHLKRIHLDTATIAGGANSAFIVPFAQRESVDAFISGMDPDLGDFITEFWGASLRRLEDDLIEDLELDGEAAAGLRRLLKDRCEQRTDEFDSAVSQRQHGSYVMPIINAVAMLPKDELGAMAESLVNLTSFKRKVSVEAETVGGPIDVAVISRGDGLVWIKRKHYFDPRLNPQYFAAKLGRRDTNGPDGQAT